MEGSNTEFSSIYYLRPFNQSTFSGGGGESARFSISCSTLCSKVLIHPSRETSCFSKSSDFLAGCRQNNHYTPSNRDDKDRTFQKNSSNTSDKSDEKSANEIEQLLPPRFGGQSILFSSKHCPVSSHQLFPEQFSSPSSSSSSSCSHSSSTLSFHLQPTGSSTEVPTGYLSDSRYSNSLDQNSSSFPCALLLNTINAYRHVSVPSNVPHTIVGG